jgi:dCMP deaminase
MIPTWDEYFISIAALASIRTKCIRRKVGAVFVRNKQILTTGYNGPPKGISHCNEVGCLREKMNTPSGERQEFCQGLHAEQNGIIQAAQHGVSLIDSDIYCTNQPCSICAKMLINVGVKRIIYAQPYNDPLAKRLLEESKIEIIKNNIDIPTIMLKLFLSV